MRLPRRDEPGPDRAGPPTLDDALEAGSQRLRDDLRRTPVRRPQVVLNKPELHRSFDRPLPGSWVTGNSLVARYMGSKWGAEPDLDGGVLCLVTPLGAVH